MKEKYGFTRYFESTLERKKWFYKVLRKHSRKKNMVLQSTSIDDSTLFDIRFLTLLFPSLSSLLILMNSEKT